MTWAWIKLTWWIVLLGYLATRRVRDLGGALAACGMLFSVGLLACEQALDVVARMRAKEA